MTIYFSKYKLDTYYPTAYFQAQLPEDYPVSLVLQKSRAFRRLPANLRRLSQLAGRWAKRHYPPDFFTDIGHWYDDQGYELNPTTGKRLTDAEIDAQWDALGDLGLSDFVVHDIPVPSGGFADPGTWEEPPTSEIEDLVDRSGLTKTQILSDIQSRGRAATAEEYGLPTRLAARASTDAELAHAILSMHGQPWSNYEED
jgi:hypothetical protein